MLMLLYFWVCLVEALLEEPKVLQPGTKEHSKGWLMCTTNRKTIAL